MELPIYWIVVVMEEEEEEEEVVGVMIGVMVVREAIIGKKEERKGVKVTLDYERTMLLYYRKKRGKYWELYNYRVSFFLF